MKILLDDADLDAQFGRTLNGALVGLADLGESFATAAPIAAGDYDGWFTAWSTIAARLRGEGDDALAAGHPAAAASRYLRASEYFRQSWWFLRHDLKDERVQQGYRAHREAFRAALPLLPYSVVPATIPFEPVDLEGYWYRPDGGDDTPRPTTIFTGGFDGTSEELMKYGALEAVERGWNAIVFDGPGQGGLAVVHGTAMRPDFEAVLTPVVDWLVARPEVDPENLLLLGRSLGGYLAPRGATGEPRITALVCDPGQVEFTSRMQSNFSDDDWAKVLAGDPAMDDALDGFLATPRDTEFWGARMRVMGADRFGEFLRILNTFTLEGRLDRITCPTLITEGEGDFASQSKQLFDGLTCEKQFRTFTAAEGAEGHCEGIGQAPWTDFAFAWLEDIVSRSRR